MTSRDTQVLDRTSPERPNQPSISVRRVRPGHRTLTPGRVARPMKTAAEARRVLEKRCSVALTTLCAPMPLTSNRRRPSFRELKSTTGNSQLVHGMGAVNRELLLPGMAFYPIPERDFSEYCESGEWFRQPECNSARECPPRVLLVLVTAAGSQPADGPSVEIWGTPPSPGGVGGS